MNSTNKTLTIDKEKIEQLDSLIKSKYDNINGLIIASNSNTSSDNVIFEKYYNDFTENDRFHIASVTKSILSALIGIVIDRNYIKSIDEKVIDFFPEYALSNHAHKNNVTSEVTIRNLLTMTAPYSFEDFKEPLDKLTMSSDWVKYALDSLGLNGKIGDFKYSTSGAHILSAILTRTTHKSAREFANEYLFKPAGMNIIPYNKIEEYNFDTLFGSKLKGWVHDHAGNSSGGWGLTLTVKDMAQFGLLYLNNGILNNKQIISKEWINKSITIHDGKNDLFNMKYGYMWWLQNDGVFSFSAIGDGGNIICCIPEKQLVIAIASTILPNMYDRWQLIKDNILPAIK